MKDMRVENQDNQVEVECSICLGCMAEPTQLTCSHRFCIGCLGKNFIQTSKCPLCRKKVSKDLEVDTEFQKQVKAAVPAEFEQRYKELDANGNLFKDQIK